MDGPAAYVRSSLDRLKALDSLADVEIQLEEARQLCTHPSRAEMIIKWLLGRIKSSLVHATHEGSWHILASCLRLLYTQKAASLLSSNGFPDALQATCAASSLPIAVIRTLTQFLDLMFDLSNTENGAPMKAVLTIHSKVAASITGDWFRHIISAYHKPDAGDSIEQWLWEVPLRLWEMRKISPMDDELFGRHCLVPISTLLALLDKSDIPSTKRKRGMDVPASAPFSRASLESLIAKHVILPARAVFFQSNEPKARKVPRKLPNNTGVGIKERLSPVKLALRSDVFVEAVAIAPLILDIALRSVSIPTPRHRSHERPWVELVFEALQSSFPSHERHLHVQLLTALVGKLIDHRFPLSSQILLDLAKNHALSTDEALNSSVYLELISALVRLDSSIFTDHELARSLFNALPPAQDPTRGRHDEIGLSLETLHATLVLIMQAFAQGRKLPVFSDLWNEQLLKPENHDHGSVWLRLSDSFADLLRGSVQEDQIITMFDKSTSDMKEVALSSHNTTDTGMECKAQASLTVLEAILRGVHADDLIKKLQTRLDDLLLALFKLTEADGSTVTSTAPCQLWKLLTRAFELWFPGWAAEQSDREVIAERGVSFLVRRTFEVALSQCATVDVAMVKGPPSAAICAQTFVATLCECFVKYDEHAQCVNLAKRALQQLVQGQDNSLPPLLKHQSLLEIVPRDLRMQILSAAMRAPHSSPSSSNEKSDWALSAILSTESEALHSDTYDIVSRQLQHPVQSLSAGESENTLLRTLYSLGKVLTLERRATLIECVVELPKVQSDLAGSRVLQDRRSLIAQILSISHGDLYFAAEPAAIWALIAMFHETQESKSSDSRAVLAMASNLELLAEIVRCVLDAWITAQGRKGVAAVPLTSFSERIRTICQDQTTFIGHVACLTLIRNALMVLEKAPENIKQDLPHRDPDTVSVYVKTLLSDIRSLSSSPSATKKKMNKKKEKYKHALDDEGEVRNLKAAFEALLAVPQPLLDRISKHETIYQKISTCLEHHAQISNQDDKLSGLDVVLFRLNCRYATKTAQDFTRQAVVILSHDLEAREFAAVLAAYENVLNTADQGWRSGAIASLLQTDANAIPSMLLLQRALKTVSKDSDPDTKSLGHKIFSHILQCASTNPDHHASHLAWQTLAMIIKEQPFLITQHDTEQIVSKMIQCSRSTSHSLSLFTDLTKTLEALFSHHRSRLQGRLHLLVALFQALITRIFRFPSSSPKVGVRQARSLARLLESSCNPPRMRHRGKTSALVDEARKAQAHAGQFAPYILHHYCAQLLSGTLESGVRAALMPGIWALIEAIEVNNSEGIKVLSAAMNNSERAMLRSVYDDWKRFGKWEGL